METKPLIEEVKKRRTFAIISHPDAGKTTLTEKLLLYSGLIRTAGMVRARKGGKSTSSDWMALEQERGISISASAMQFHYKDQVINVLDTPGHQDFSEDTYRTLTAADSAIMVLDAGKGVEIQTRKLFEVCRLRGIPIITFINKMDLPGRDPLDLMSEVEEVLGINSSAYTWPIGSGRGFCGVVDRHSEKVILFEKGEKGGSGRAEAEEISLASAKDKVPAELWGEVESQLELLKVAGNKFDHKEFLEGKVTPVFFGSALTNFGVEPFFDTFVDLAPSPKSYSQGSEGELVLPEADQFSGFVFKIQTNMNPKHRDSMAFIRVCSGKFERDMAVKVSRTQKTIRLSRSFSMVSKDRETTDLAFAGDVVGVINPGGFLLGDTVSESGKIEYPPLPKFLPEVFASIRPLDVMKKKSFDKGIASLSAEGTVQLLEGSGGAYGAMIIAAVGQLQFEVLQYRLEDEYGVKTELNILPYKYSLVITSEKLPSILPSQSRIARDAGGRNLVLIANEWEKKYIEEKNDGVVLSNEIQ